MESCQKARKIKVHFEKRETENKQAQSGLFFLKACTERAGLGRQKIARPRDRPGVVRCMLLTWKPQPESHISSFVKMKALPRGEKKHWYNYTYELFNTSSFGNHAKQCGPFASCSSPYSDINKGPKSWFIQKGFFPLLLLHVLYCFALKNKKRALNSGLSRKNFTTSSTELEFLQRKNVITIL